MTTDVNYDTRPSVEGQQCFPCAGWQTQTDWPSEQPIGRHPRAKSRKQKWQQARSAAGNGQRQLCQLVIGAFALLPVCLRDERQLRVGVGKKSCAIYARPTRVRPPHGRAAERERTKARMGHSKQFQLRLSARFAPANQRELISPQDYMQPIFQPISQQSPARLPWLPN